VKVPPTSAPITAAEEKKGKKNRTANAPIAVPPKKRGRKGVGLFNRENQQQTISTLFGPRNLAKKEKWSIAGSGNLYLKCRPARKTGKERGKGAATDRRGSEAAPQDRGRREGRRKQASPRGLHSLSIIPGRGKRNQDCPGPPGGLNRQSKKIKKEVGVFPESNLFGVRQKKEKKNRKQLAPKREKKGEGTDKALNKEIRPPANMLSEEKNALLRPAAAEKKK